MTDELREFASKYFFIGFIVGMVMGALAVLVHQKTSMKIEEDLQKKTPEQQSET